MSNFESGNVVIVNSGQAGTIVQITGKEVWVLLANGDVWTGVSHQLIFPQDEAHLAACPLNVERLEAKRIIRSED
jgi:preprotein translocase subunit YajC